MRIVAEVVCEHGSVTGHPVVDVNDKAWRLCPGGSRRILSAFPTENQLEAAVLPIARALRETWEGATGEHAAGPLVDADTRAVALLSLRAALGADDADTT